MNVWDFAGSFMQPYKVKGAEIVPKLCPVCDGGPNNDKETFALNFDKKTCNCKRQKCDASVGWHFTQLCKFKGVEAEREERFLPSPKLYKAPVKLPQTPKQKVEEYLKARGFSKETWEVPQAGKIHRRRPKSLAGRSWQASPLGNGTLRQGKPAGDC